MNKLSKEDYKVVLPNNEPLPNNYVKIKMKEKFS